MKRLLVIGSDTIVGSNLALHLSTQFRVTAVCKTQNQLLPGCDMLACDVDDPSRVALIIRRVVPDWIIHCGPLSRSSWELTDAAPTCTEALIVNAIAQTAADVGSRCFIVVGDAAAAGRRLFADESMSSVVPGWSQAVCDLERILQKTATLVVRTHAYGWSPTAMEPGFAEGIHQAITTMKTVQVRALACATPILATDLADLLVLAYQQDLQGLLHLAGAERTSAAGFAAELANAFGLRPCSLTVRVGRGAPKPAAETSLSCALASRSLGVPMPMLADGLGRFAIQAKYFRWQLQGGTRRHAA